MVIKITALSSGSSGNCYYVSSDKGAILVDAGISCKKIMERMHILNLDSSKIKAIFLTHEHSDHIRGADVLARELNIPIYATKGTIESGFICSNDELINTIKTDETIKIAGFDVESFSKSHKATEPVSFSISQNKTVSIMTDLGYACKRTMEQIGISDFIFLESNHDIKMLEQGPYPWFLKRWVSSDTGHLSNMQASLAVLENANSKIRNVVLSHLSSTNNTPKLALKTFNQLLKERKDFKANVDVSLKDKPTNLFKI